MTSEQAEEESNGIAAHGCLAIGLSTARCAAGCTAARQVAEGTAGRHRGSEGDTLAQCQHPECELKHARPSEAKLERICATGGVDSG